MTSAPVVMTQETCGDEETAGVWPWNNFVLRPPASNDNAGNKINGGYVDKVSALLTPDIEPEHECDWNQIRVLLTMKTNLLKLFLKLNTILLFLFFGFN